MNRNTIGDPQQSLQIKDIKILAQTGKIAEIDFPFVLTTEIDGTIFIETAQSRKPADNTYHIFTSKKESPSSYP